MKAILMTAVGKIDVLKYQDIPEPEILETTQIKIKLQAAGVNPVDTKVRHNGLFFDQPLPAVLGCDGAGIVVETGTAVSQFKVGDKVWFCNGGLGREQGNYAQYTVLDERWVSLSPKTFSFIEAAAAPLVLITAWGALFDRGGLQAGQTVLIHAGTGGVGHVAIQLAKLKGAKVITTVSSAQKADFVKNLGADEAIIYTQQDFVATVNELTDGKGADLVFDTVGSAVFEKSIAATAHFGRLITLLDPGELNLNEARMRNLLIGFELMLTPMLRDLPEARDKHINILNNCAQWADQGLLKLHVSKQLPLKEAAIAHQLIETGHTTGKIVLSI
ncbi:zinc-dependent alcohol dehydrogenase family protein [Methylobacter psychrophilus]|uniref:zinc-dependent alcohol dehydrogenase family protein n=1 Tax=Methylobacter psychrophilus TaxID=96941 RepID=UPI0021D4B13F|nr:zinc-dependent alcohol dehydrogenase family protein [Methylobacter psychrophilus]